MIPLCTTFLLLAASASAQAIGGGTEILHQWGGETPYDSFGKSVSAAGDVNGDGFPDVIVGAPDANPGGLSKAGAAYVYSGADGSLLYRWIGQEAKDGFGHDVSAAGDVNADGFDDVIVGTYLANAGGVADSGSAYVYSGLDGSLLYQWDGAADRDYFGKSVSTAGDVNGDGFSDLIIGAPNADFGNSMDTGSAFVYSGFDGTLLYQWDGATAFDNLGRSVSSAGDTNGDGFDDVIVSAPFTEPTPNAWNAGSVFVYSGADGTLLYQWDGLAAYDSFGHDTAAAGDVNGDGFSDILISSKGTNSEDRGSAYVYSGMSGALLFQWTSQTSGDFYGFSVDGAGDLNADGFDDLLVGAYMAEPHGLVKAGSAYAYSGADGSMLHQWNGAAEGDRFGFCVAHIGDFDADGFDDVLFGAFADDAGGLTDTGAAYLFNFEPFLYISHYSISATTGGTLNFDLDFPYAAGFDRYRILISALGTGPTNFGVDIPLSLDTMAWNSYFNNYPFPVSSNLHGTLDLLGDASASATLPAGLSPSLIGNTYHFAAIANKIGQLPEFSSIALSVQITP